MKRSLLLIILVLSAVLPGYAGKREHRATWMSGYISDWPTAPITESNAEETKRIGLANLDSLQRNNFTTVYFHVRTMCDAMYDSKYEPWSSYIAPARGQQPAFDPFRFILDNAHERGIEVYAWLNPYRYLNSSVMTGWGGNGGDKNYENSHPEWLIEYQYLNKEGKTITHTILNPALPEVKQRIVDVIADLLSKYDVDGVVFDDYFYQNGLPMSYDAKHYNDYVAGGGMLSQADWRRENVNDMVRIVNTYIKANKPWVRFGIGPAGVAASSESVASKYGVEPCPGSDWQYNEIYSDPLAWYSEGTIDFMSPQVYWIIGNSSADYAKITPWWYEVAKKFNRHCYISQDISANIGKASSLDEFSTEIEMTRASDEMGAPGFVFFPWKTLKSGTKGRLGMMRHLINGVYSEKSLTPAVTWMKAECPGEVSALKRDGRTISWNGPGNVRYTIYAVPKSVDMNSFRKEAEYLMGISYGDTYDIPDFEKRYPDFGIADADIEDYNYAVAILDRYGNEYAPYFVGASAVTAAKPVISYPVEGMETPTGFDFRWTGNSQQYELVIATDPEMENVIFKKELSDQYLFSSETYGFEPETTYYCMVVGRSNNAVDVKSDVVSFRVNVFRITSPADGQEGCADNPVVYWSAATESADYELQIADGLDFEEIVWSGHTTATSLQVPEFVLTGNTVYYAKVTATVGDSRYATEPSEFTTAVIEGTVPEFVTPSANGITLHSNQSIAVKPQRGVTRCKIMVCSDGDFSARKSYNVTLSDFVFNSPELSEISILGEGKLVDGTTYYAKANVAYRDEEGRTVETEWTEPVSFVYSAEAGAHGIEDDGITLVGGEEPAVEANKQGVEVFVYGTDGKLLMTAVTGASGRVSLSSLDSGAYMIAVKSDAGIKTFKFLK